MKTAAEINSIEKKAIKKNSSSFSKYFRRNYDYYLLLLPGALLLILFRFVPLYGIITAFKDFSIFKGLDASPWVGFKWFKVLFSSPDFLQILKNSISISVLELVFVFPAPIILAILLNELQHDRFKKVVQTVSYLPHFLSWVIVGGFIIQFLQPYTGPVRHIFNLLGLQPKMLLLDKNWFYPILFIGEIWKGIGWGTILYLAALAGIDVEQYEAAHVDGATRWQRIWHVTLPGLAFVIVLQFVLASGRILEVGFEKIWVLSNDNIREVADVFSTYNFRVGIGQQRYSISTAISLFESVIGFIFVTSTNWLSKKLGQEAPF